jgi:hypothetical protein
MLGVKSSLSAFKKPYEIDTHMFAYFIFRFN